MHTHIQTSYIYIYIYTHTCIYIYSNICRVGAEDALRGARALTVSCGGARTLVVSSDGCLWSCGMGGGSGHRFTKKISNSSLLSDWPHHIYIVLTTCIKGNREEGKKGWMSSEPLVFSVNWAESREQTALYSVNWLSELSRELFFFFLSSLWTWPKISIGVTMCV